MLPDLPSDGQRAILTNLIDTNVRIIIRCQLSILSISLEGQCGIESMNIKLDPSPYVDMLFVRFYAFFFHRICRDVSCFCVGILECPSNVYTSVRLKSFFLFGRYVVRIGITPSAG
jgi:hypothetical protein